MNAAAPPPTHFWLRTETKPNESRSPITPNTAQQLVAQGCQVSVERSDKRVFPDEEFATAGCRIVTQGSWGDAPHHAYIIGLKELPDADGDLRHRHIYFGHAYKGQPGATKLLQRFHRGGGTLLDLETLADDHGRRVAAFGYWAGYAGAALALASCRLQAQGKHLAALSPFDSQDGLNQFVQACLGRERDSLLRRSNCLVIGARGRSGQGAIECLEQHGCQISAWDLEETAKGGPFSEINHHDILVNCVLLSTATPPFVSPESLGHSPRLRTIADVSCDPHHIHNPLPIYNQHTSFHQPSQLIQGQQIRIISIDNLPSLLPRESSEDFAGQLLPHLLEISHWTEPWANTQKAFKEASHSVI